MWPPSIASGDQVTSYVYAADDTQLIRTDPDGSATLFLPDGTELAATSDGVRTGTRYLEFGGQGLIQQTKAGKWVLYADQTGTATVAHNMVTLTTYVRRTQDPFGNQLSGTLGGVWPNQRGYLNKPYSSFTNITDIGARKYDPVTGRFTSVDPQLDPAAPATHNGYAYTAADPINQVDPTGLGVWDTIKGGFNSLVSAVKNFFTAPPANTGPSSSSAAPYQPASSGNTPASAPAFTEPQATVIATGVSTVAGVAVGAATFGVAGPIGAQVIAGMVSEAVYYISYQLLTGQDINIEDLILTTIIGGLTSLGFAKLASSPALRQAINKHVAAPLKKLLGKGSTPATPAAAKPPKTTTPTPTTPTQGGATAAGRGSSGIGAGGSGSSPNLVYRGLASNENPANGLVARAPDAIDVSPISHVAGKYMTPWISTSRSYDVASSKYGANGVAAIDLDKIYTEVVDISTGIPGGGRMSNWAKSDQEVLIKGHVPADAILGWWN